MALARHGCRNFLLVVVFLAIVGFGWAIRTDASSDPLLGFAKWMVGVTSLGVLSFTVIGVITQFRWIADWFAVPRPPLVDHPVLGELHYEDRSWEGRAGAVQIKIGGRRRGPEAEFIDAAARIVGRLAEFELRARSYALDRVPALADEPLGELLSVTVSPSEPDRAAEVSLWFRLWRCEHDSLEVAFVAEQPVRMRRPQCAAPHPGEIELPIPD